MELKNSKKRKQWGFSYSNGSYGKKDQEQEEQDVPKPKEATDHPPAICEDYDDIDLPDMEEI